MCKCSMRPRTMPAAGTAAAGANGTNDDDLRVCVAVST